MSTLDRRKFIKLAGGASATLLSFNYFACGALDPMQRIGMATVMVRTRIASTAPSWASPDLTLLEVPAYFRDRFGIYNVDLWTRHFEERSPSYIHELKARLRKSRSILINIQIDDNFDISSLDRSRRERSLELAKSWIGTAADLGALAVRVNAGKENLDNAIASYKKLNAYANRLGVIMQCENHFGVESIPENHLRIIREVNHKNFHTLPDFGNWPEYIDLYKALEKVMPYAYQVSAKMKELNAHGEHVSYDFDKCMQIAEESGFNGIYTVEQYGGDIVHLDFEAVGDLIIQKIKYNLYG